MGKDGAREIHTLIMAFMGFLHQRLFIDIRKNQTCCSQLSKNQFKIINIVYHYQDGLTATEIGRMLDIEKGSLTTMIDQLEAIDMIVRRTDPRDRRKVLVSLSESGGEQMEKTMQAYSAALDDLFKGVPPQEMEKFVECLRYVVDFTGKL